MKRLALTTFFVLATSATANARYWNWTPNCQHHQAVASIVMDGTHPFRPKSGGTAVLITHNHMVTAAHLVENEMVGELRTGVAKFPAGEVRYRTIAIDRANDLAILETSQAVRILPVKVALYSVKPGEKVEVCGFGGPAASSKMDLRHFLGIAEGGTTANCCVISGDSGGPIFNTKHELVGIVSGGPNTAPFTASDGSRWELVYPCMHSGATAINALMERANITRHQGSHSVQGWRQPGGT